MLYYRNNLPVIKTVYAPHDYVLAEAGCPIVRHPYNYFIDEVLDPTVDMKNSFYKKHWPNDPVSEARIKMCQAKVFEQDGFNGLDPVDVMINDIGQFVILDGNHRACIQLRFNGGIIRMNVRYISPIWKKFVDYIESIRDGHGKIYQKIEHPYFVDIPYHYGTERVEAIHKSMTAGGTANSFVFEIGCNTGMFSRFLATKGLFPVGFDISHDNVMACEHLSRAARLRGWYFHESNVLNVLGAHADNSIGTVLCLSVIHHYARKGDHKTLREYVKEVARVGVVSFIDSETAQGGRDKYYKPGEMPNNEYMENVFTDLGLKCSKVFTCSIGRTIYRVTK